MDIELEKIAVIGAGVMGTGVAQSLVSSGFEVVVVDCSSEALRRCEAEIRRAARFAGMFADKGARPVDAAALERLRFSTSLADAGSSDAVIENVTETWDAKKPVFEALGRLCPEHCVLASNTSTISVTRSGSVSGRPEQVLGMHFMNPVPMISTVEVIRGLHTSDRTIEVGLALLARMGKEGVVVRDMPGFVSNRVLMLTINEAIWLVQDGVSTPEDVDRIFRECMGHRMGPLATADLIGLDTILYSLEALQDQFGDPKFRACPLLRQMVHGGHLGAKSGEGFYRH